MVKNHKLPIIAGLLTSAAIVGAAVTIDGDGFGFVGKGTVQSAFDWNNHTMQQNHEGITFNYEAETRYGFVCEWTTGVGTPGETYHTTSHTRKVSVSADLASNSRRTGQWTGWFLNGFEGDVSESGTIPVDGGPCPGFPGAGRTVKAGSVEVGETVGGLFACFEGDCRLLQ
jgi:hypothetical protein